MDTMITKAALPMLERIAPISQGIWDAKYRLKSQDGTPVDMSIEDTWRRVARHLASVEAEPEAWEERFYAAMEDFKFLPAGRIVCGAGTNRAVTLFNCFVMGDIEDNLRSIMHHVGEAALTMQQGGGIGYDFSSLRPKGAPVKGVGADASGPLSFMDVWNTMCSTIMSAGSRRGAMMGTMRCDHPDIEAFIDVKRDPARLRQFNLSILVTDAFMAAVEGGKSWDLVFGGKIYRTMPAKDLWAKIMKATYDYAEPGVLFIDRINARNNLHYCETIHCTNPCVTADTWVATTEGPRQVQDLLGRQFTALVDGVPYESTSEGFFHTGRKETFTLLATDGNSLRATADHRIMSPASRSHRSIGREWVKIGDLSVRDAIVLHNHRSVAGWTGSGTAAEGYLLGLMIGDKTISSGEPTINTWSPTDTTEVAHPAMEAAHALPLHGELAGWMDDIHHAESHLVICELGKNAKPFGLDQHRAIIPVVERASSEFQIAFLRALFDSAGSVHDSVEDRKACIHLAQSDIGRLEAVQRILGRLGIISSVLETHSIPGIATSAIGGGVLHKGSFAHHGLVIWRDNIDRYADLIGFRSPEKMALLDAVVSACQSVVHLEPFVTTVESVDSNGLEDVYDCRIPGINAFDGNGFYVHNCGEQPLPAYGACLLGSINLAALVTDAFTPEARIDSQDVADLVSVAVRMLDNTIDASGFPLDEQKAEAYAKRRIGLGVTGLADALAMIGARYGSQEAAEMASGWMEAIERAAYITSAGLAKEKGAFPLYREEEFLAGETVRGLAQDLQDVIREAGVRNGVLTSIAPTGTISLVADNVSSGIEPMFQHSYARTINNPDGSKRKELVEDHAVALYRRKFGENAALPEHFVTADALTPAQHILMMAAVQRHTDAAISKTVNVPEDIAFEDFERVYFDAYHSGCKGCATYRPNDITGSILTATPESVKQETPSPLALLAAGQTISRPKELPGVTYKLKSASSSHAVYVTINDIEDASGRRPLEIFVNSANQEHHSWVVALTRMISAIFKRGGDVAFVADELKDIFDPTGGQFVDGHYVPSLVAAIGQTLERHMIATGFMPAPDTLEPLTESKASVAATAKGMSCVSCHQPSVFKQSGCKTCTNCGWSTCS